MPTWHVVYLLTHFLQCSMLHLAVAFESQRCSSMTTEHKTAEAMLLTCIRCCCPHTAVTSSAKQWGFGHVVGLRGEEDADSRWDIVICGSTAHLDKEHLLDARGCLYD